LFALPLHDLKGNVMCKMADNKDSQRSNKMTASI